MNQAGVKNKLFGTTVAVVAAGMVMAGCGNSGGANTGGTQNTPPSTPAASSDEYTGGPVELLIQDKNTAITQEEFDKYFAAPVKAKYPNITLKLTMERDTNKLLAAGTAPDLIAVASTTLVEYLEMDYPEDLTPMINRFKIDLNKFEPSIIEVLKEVGENKGVFGLPFGMNYGALVYNKDIFNKFGVPYPKDVITWDDFLQLGRQLTRQDGGVQYVGGTPSSVLNLIKQYGASNVDDKNEKAILSSDKHKYVYSLLDQFFKIPGVVNGNVYLHQNIMTGTLAMQNGWITSFSTTFMNKKPDFDWGLAAHPVFKEKPNLGNPIDFHMLTVNKAGKNKEAAYRVLLTLISEETQTALSKNRRLTPLKDEKVKLTFATDSDVFTGKNLQSIFKVQPSPLPDYSTWKPIIDPFANNVAKDIALNGIDVNTATREQEEKANLAIQAEVAKAK